MLSKEQEMLINERVARVVNAFIRNDYTIKELSQELGIPSSTIQRDLNNVERISEVFGVNNTPLVLEVISEKLNKNKREGLSLGGTNSVLNNVSTRDEDGKFNGSFKRR